jgi:hypothetical protein
MKWITREHAKVDRVACPWLIRRFIDPQAEFLFVPADQVLPRAATEPATPFDTPGAELHHYRESGEDRCSFDAFLRKYHLTDPALVDLAEIVRSADTHTVHPRPEAAGLEAMAHGFRATARNDLENLERQFPAYDALFAYCRDKVAGRARLEHSAGRP